MTTKHQLRQNINDDGGEINIRTYVSSQFLDMRLLHDSISNRGTSQAGRKRVYNAKDGELFIGDLWLIAGCVLALSHTVEIVLLDELVANDPDVRITLPLTYRYVWKPVSRN